MTEGASEATCAPTALSDVRVGVVIIVAEADLVRKISTSVRTGRILAFNERHWDYRCQFCVVL